MESEGYEISRMKKPVYILGVTYFGNHESAAALLRDGVLVAAAEEERFTRVKFDRSFPTHSIEFCLDQAGISIENINHVGFFWKPWRGIGKRIAYAIRGLPGSLSRGSRGGRILFDLLSAERVLRRETGYSGPFHHIEHHLTHAASVFFSSPHEKAAVLSIDGTGETATCWIGTGNGNSLTPHRTTAWPHSLGHVYATVTQYLGFRAFEDEYKVMGLAAYGTPDYLHEFRKIIVVEDGALNIDLRYLSYQYFAEHWYSDRWVKTFGPPRSPNHPIDQRHKSIAASIQARLEEVLIELASYAVRTSGHDTLCLSGGVALNAVAVGALARSGICSHVYTNPVSGDSGTSLGAALHIHHAILGNASQHPLTHAYWGPTYSDNEIEDALKKHNLAYERLHSPAHRAAELLAAGDVIGWFQGRAEYGQRALGNRSILADPRRKEIKEKLNVTIKHRESFRPFAPSVLTKYQSDYFEWSRSCPFMTEVHAVRATKQAEIAAVVHADGTARLQTVEGDTNPLFAQLISEFHVRTGTPLILNTSFNVAGEPIVNSPDDAIITFQNAELDALVIGNFLVLRKNA